VLAGSATNNVALIDSLKSCCDVTEVGSTEQALDLIRRGEHSAIFAGVADFLPLERALVSQQANLILNTIGEGVCIINSDGRFAWMNKKMQNWPPAMHDKIRHTCQEAFDIFSKQVSPGNADIPAYSRSKRYALNIEDTQFMEMIASPVIQTQGNVVQVVCVVWDATGTRRLQQKIDAIDKAGRELVRIEGDAIKNLNVAQRLKLMEEKIISYTRELMHFDHFAIRLLDRRTNKLELVISAGLPAEALSVELLALPEGNGISGYVASTGKSYICPDVERDPRYVMGLDQARSTLTVPLTLYDKVIGIFNIESRQRAAFNEDDRQFAEIFGRYVALALNILDLMIFERVVARNKVTEDVCSEMAGPLNDIDLDANALLGECNIDDANRSRLQQILNNVASIRKSLAQAVQGPQNILGVADVKVTSDPVLANARVLVADDEPNIRFTIQDVLRKYQSQVTVCSSGREAIAGIEANDYDLVLSDIKMPDKSGYDVFAAAKKRKASLPVIFMTGFGYDPNHNIVRASQEGLAAVLFKPFKVEQLLQEVRKALTASGPK